MKRFVIIPIMALGLLLLGCGSEPPPIQAEQILSPDAKEDDKDESKVTDEKEGAEAETDTTKVAEADTTKAAESDTTAAAKAEAVTEGVSVRYFLYISTPKEGAGEAAPAELQAAEDGLTSMVEGIGGKLHGFFWGLGTGRNYITISVPNDSKIVQSMYGLRKAGAPLSGYEEIILMTNADLIAALSGGAK